MSLQELHSRLSDLESQKHSALTKEDKIHFTDFSKLPIRQ